MGRTVACTVGRHIGAERIIISLLQPLNGRLPSIIALMVATHGKDGDAVARGIVEDGLHGRLPVGKELRINRFHSRTVKIGVWWIVGGICVQAVTIAQVAGHDHQLRSRIQRGYLLCYGI